MYFTIAVATAVEISPLLIVVILVSFPVLRGLLCGSPDHLGDSTPVKEKTMYPPPHLDCAQDILHYMFFILVLTK